MTLKACIISLYLILINKATKEVVGFKRHRQVEGMPKELEQLCEKRREAKRKMIQQPKSAILKEEYKMLNFGVKKGVKKKNKTNLKIKSNNLKVILEQMIAIICLRRFETFVENQERL